MKILVCISHVPDTTSKINFSEDNTKFDSNGVQFVINPYDEFALTRAMWFKEKQGASVTVATVGGSNVEPTLRKALAIGADDAIRIDTEPTDGFLVAKQLSEVIKTEGFDLILTGKESIDYNGGMVPGMIAELLGFNFVNACIGLEVENNKATAIREIDGGKEVLTCDLPMIAAGQKGMVEEKVVAPADVSESTSTAKYEKPLAKGACKMVDANNIDELIKLLHDEAKVI